MEQLKVLSLGNGLKALKRMVFKRLFETDFPSFPYNVFTFSKKTFNIRATFKSSSASAFELDTSRSLLYGKGLDMV